MVSVSDMERPRVFVPNDHHPAESPASQNFLSLALRSQDAEAYLSDDEARFGFFSSERSGPPGRGLRGGRRWEGNREPWTASILFYLLHSLSCK